MGGGGNGCKRFASPHNFSNRDSILGLHWPPPAIGQKRSVDYAKSLTKASKLPAPSLAAGVSTLLTMAMNWPSSRQTNHLIGNTH